MRRKFILMTLFVALLVRAADAFYGFNGDPAHQENWQESTLIGQNAYQVKMTMPDGFVLMLQRDPSDPHALICPHPWVGEYRGMQALVMTDPEAGVGQTGYLFDKGILKGLMLGGTEYEVQQRPDPDASVESLWPEVTASMVKDAYDYYRIHWDRLVLWYDNPNYAAALLVQVILAGFLLLSFKSVFLRLLGAPVALAGLVGLMMTRSRGGMMALLCAGAVVVLFRLRSWLTWRRLLLALLVVASVLGLMWYFDLLTRFTTELFKEGYSDNSRLPLWAAAPRMIVSSAAGWGLGQAGTAYMDWFQPLDRFHVIGTLINSHLTLLVEFGWPMRLVYIFGWCVGLPLLAARAIRGASVFPLAIWVAFFVGSIFNSIGVEWSLWVLPFLALAATLRPKGWLDRLAAIWAGGIGVLLGTVVVAIVLVLGNRKVPDEVKIVGDADRVIVNGEAAATWIVDDGQVLSGNCFGILGKDVRTWYRAHADAPAVGFVTQLASLPEGVRRLVLVGRKGREFLSVWEQKADAFDQIEEIVFLSPSFGWKAIPEDLRARHAVRCLIGSFAARLPENSGNLPSWVKSVPGCALYINGWQRYVCR